MTGAQIRQLRLAIRMDPAQFAQLLGIHASSVYRWEMAADAEVRIEPFQRQILTALEDQLAQRAAPAQADLGGAILKGLLIGGGLFGLFKLLEAVFEEPEPRRTRVAKSRSTGVRARRSPTKTTRRT